VSSLAGQSLNGHSPRWVTSSFAEASSCVVAQGERRVSQIRHLAGAAASVTLGERPGHSRARPIGVIGRARFTVDLRPATAGKGLPAEHALVYGWLARRRQLRTPGSVTGGRPGALLR
jgi:hypothetical protein